MKTYEKKYRLLAGLFILLICLLFYFVPYKKLHEEEIALKNELQELQGIYNQLSVDIPKKEEFENGIIEAKKIIQIYDELLPSQLPQDLFIYTLNNIEKEIGIHFSTVSLGTETPMQRIEKNQENSETINNEAIEVEKNTAKADEVGIYAEVTVATQLTYAQFKELLDHLYQTQEQGQKNRVVLTDLQLTNDPSANLLNASFSLTFYGLKSEDREKGELDLGNFNIGRDNVFTPISEFGSKKEINTDVGAENKKSDFFIMLSPITADQTTVIMGKTSGMSSAFFAYADENDFTDVFLEIDQREGKYFYQYKAGRDLYPKEGEVYFQPGTEINLAILSNKRNSDEDRSGANISLINHSDIPLRVVISDDDPNSSRIHFVKTEGNVLLP